MTAEDAAALRLSHDYLADIPEEILLKRDTITALDLSGNPDNSQHSFLSQFKNVKKLVFNRCALRGIPVVLSELTQLEELDLSSNNFEEGLNTTIGRLHRLKKLELGSCKLKAIPDCLGDLEELEELDLSSNKFSDGLHSAIGRLFRLKKLDLQTCELQCVPDSLGDLGALEELDLSANNFFGGVNPRIGRLHHLKKLFLRACELTAVPDSLGDLEALEELCLLRNKFDGDLYPTIGRLHQLKKLFLGACKLGTVCDSIRDLRALQELHLSSNKFSNGITPAIGLLHQLKKLFLRNCDLRTVPDKLGDLELLQELHLSGNVFSDGINPAIGRLHQLKKLFLQDCDLRKVPDELGDLVLLEELDLSSNLLSEGLNPTIGRLCWLKKLFLQDCGLSSFPVWLVGLRALEQLDLSSNKFFNGLHPSIGLLHGLKKLDLRSSELKTVPDSLADLNASSKEEKVKGNCIKHLPVELAFTRLRKLELEGNPITQPPEAIWTQGIDAIKSFMRALIPGGQLMCADTINMIGDTGAGKTSVAQSLIAQSPRPTAACDCTRVMQQRRMIIDETSGKSVNINDFGGHQIYHSVMPIFLPANGLLILVLDLTNRMQVQNIEKWLLTAIAKSREIRILIAGTHADELANVRERSTLEEHIAALSSSVLRTAIDEVSAHISHIESRPRNINMQSKLKVLYQLMSNLNGATIRVVTLSCSVPDEGLPKLRALAVELLLPAAIFPIRWCYIVHEIMKLSPAGFYIQISQVQDIAKVYFTTEDDDSALTTILRFLAKMSLVIWVEDHPRLRNVVFHLPQKIIDVCKKIFHHDSQSFPVHFRSSWEEYENGIVPEPLLRALLKIHTVGHDRCQGQTAPAALPFEVAVDFLVQFNLVSCVSTKSDGKRFVIPGKLPAHEHPELTTFYQTAENCTNRISIRLTFIGCIVPMSFFETCLSAMLTIAGQLFHPAVYPWKSGLIVIHGGVHFLAKLCDDSITLTAFSEPPVASPWTVLQPMLRGLNEHAVMWSGAPPSCAVECPWCVRHRQCEYSKNEVRGIETDLQTLAQLEQESDVDPTCPKCSELIPRSLCFPPASRGSFAEEQRKIQDFFETTAKKRPKRTKIEVPYKKWNQQKTGRAVVAEATHETATGSMTSREWDCMDKEQLREQFRKNYTALLDNLTKEEVRGAANTLFSQKNILKSELEQVLLPVNTPTQAAQTLIDCICKKDKMELYRAFLEILKSQLKRCDLVKDLVTLKP